MNTEDNIENQAIEELQDSEKFNSDVVNRVCQNCGSHDGRYCECGDDE